MKDLSPLQVALLDSLADGMESTLLVVQILLDTTRGVGDSPGEISESRVLEALTSLEEKGLVRSTRQQVRPNKPGDATGNIPELAEARSQILWWELTSAGRKVRLT